jgi:type II pantothenate kinase
LSFLGLDFFITEIPNEVFTYNDTDTEPMQFAEARPNVYPYLLVNIGSGVSMIKVSGPNKFQRVGGTHLGGGTFWGIMSLLTGARTFDDMLAMADRGDNSGVDMLVGDIYGMDYSKIGLKSTAIASTFGKVFRLKNAAEQGAEDGEGLYHDDSEHANGNGGVNFQHEDMSRSLLYAIRYVYQTVIACVYTSNAPANNSQ